jgi:MoaD family protein
MKIRMQLFSRLKDAAGKEHVDLALKDGATVRDLLGELFLQFPQLKPWEQSILVGAGVEFVDRDYQLKSGDEISIMPPVQGG